jgi:hypothetical protein
VSRFTGPILQAAVFGGQKSFNDARYNLPGPPPRAATIGRDVTVGAPEIPSLAIIAP